MDGLDQGARLAAAQRRHGRQKFDNGTNASIVMHACIILLKCHKNFSILYYTLGTPTCASGTIRMRNCHGFPLSCRWGRVMGARTGVSVTVH